MPKAITKKELIEHLNQHFTDESLLVADIWSSKIVEEFMQEPDTDRSMDIWADIAEDFAKVLDFVTRPVYDLLHEQIMEKE